MRCSCDFDVGAFGALKKKKKTLTLARLLGIKTKDECARGFLSLHMLCSFPFPFSLSLADMFDI